MDLLQKYKRAQLKIKELEEKLHQARKDNASKNAEIEKNRVVINELTTKNLELQTETISKIDVISGKTN